MCPVTKYRRFEHISVRYIMLRTKSSEYYKCLWIFLCMLYKLVIKKLNSADFRVGSTCFLAQFTEDLVNLNLQMKMNSHAT